MKPQEALFEQFVKQYPELRTARNTRECIMQIFFKEHPYIFENNRLIYYHDDDCDEPQPYIDGDTACLFYRWAVTKGLYTPKEARTMIDKIWKITSENQ